MKKRDKSILQKDMTKCFICGCTHNLQTHEVFFGTANRTKSIDWGLYVRLCSRHHNGSNNAVHYNHQMDLNLKQYAQRTFEKKYSREAFMNIFHKNYLVDEEVQNETSDEID